MVDRQNDLVNAGYVSHVSGKRLFTAKETYMFFRLDDGTIKGADGSDGVNGKEGDGDNLHNPVKCISFDSAESGGN